MSENPELSLLKVEIISVLASASSTLNVQQFLREYRDLVGKKFPHAKLGFRTPVDLLRSIPDVITIKTNEMGEILVPNQNNSFHISKMVQEQKKNPKKGRPRPVQLPRDSQKIDFSPLQRIDIPNPVGVRGWERPPRMQPLMNITSPYNSSFLQFSHNLWKFDSQPMVLNTFSTMQTEFTATKLPLIPKKEPLVEPKINLSVTDGYCDNGDPCSSNSKVLRPDDNLTNNKEISQIDVKADNSIPENLRKVEDFQNFKVGGSEVSSSTVSYEGEEEDSCPISEKMKENFRKILSKHKSGLLVSKLASSYLKMFNVSLNCQDYGFPTIKDLVMSCHDVFKIQQKKRGKDWLLFDINNESDDSTKWIPTQVLENMQELSLAYPMGISSDDVLKLYKNNFKVDLDVTKLGFESLTSFLVNCQSIECIARDDKYVVFPMKWGKKDDDPEESTSDPFLSVDTYSIFHKKPFQESVCGFQFHYKKCPIPKETTLKVLVADCISPDKLWLQTLDAATSLSDLMFELNSFYDEEEQDYIMEEEFVHPGLACCVKFNNKQWHRGLIEEIMEDSGAVKIIYVDYGTSCLVSIKDLHTLHKRFSEAPIYSFKSKIHNVKPMNDKSWSEDCLEFLFSLILNDILVAEIVEIKGEVASVILIDTKDSEDRVINFVLIESGFALPVIEPLNNNQSENHVSNNADEGMGLPLKKPYPNYFMKVLPYWLHYGQQSWSDVFQVFEQASQNSYSDSSKYNASDLHSYLHSSQCIEDRIFDLFIKKPKIVCNAWDKTFYSLIDVFEKRFLENIETELWNICNETEYKTRYMTSSVNGSETSSNPKTVFDKEKSPGNINGEMNSHRIQRTDQCYSSHENGNYTTSSSSDSTPKDERVTEERKGPKILPANVFNTVIHLIRYNSEIYVSMDELLLNFAKGVPSILVKHRLKQHQINVAPFIVTPQNKLLYNELRSKNFKNGTVSLVPLSLSSDIVRAVEPRNKRVSEVLKELTNECYSSEEFWSA